MTRFFKKAFKSGLFIFLFLSSVSADVKLRLYLKDGSLQSGNLVSETDSLFVLLTKNGREEIVKDKIMFVNGKPLMYWKQHPERNYQTEIIPTDVPNPSFVNDKAALPQVALAPATPLPKIEAVLPTPSKPMPTPPPQAAKKIVMPTPTPAPVVTPTPTPAVHPAEEKVKTTEQEAHSRPAMEAKTLPRPLRIKRSVRLNKAPTVLSAFSREGMAAYFADRGNRYLDQGSLGRAMQDFHMAVMLNRQDMDSSLKLGRLYAQQGIRKWAEKYLITPGLKKNSEAKELMEKLAQDEKRNDRQRNFLYAGVGVGFLSLFPLMLLLRRFTKAKEPHQIIISADQLEGLVVPVEETVKAPEPEIAFVEDIRETPKPVPIVPAPPPIERAAPVIPEPKPVEPPKILEPMPIPAFSPVAEEPRFDPVPELVSSLPSDSSKKTMDDLIRSREDFLQVSRSVDDLIAKGHALAAEGSFEKSRKTYRTALALHPQSLEAMLGLAYLCFIQENWEMALEYYLHAAQINPKSADVHYGIGRVFLETGHEAEAVQEFRQTLSLDPTFYEARETLSALGVAV